MATPSQPPVPPAFSDNVGDDRDAALHAAEKELQAAREALQAAEQKLAEARVAAAATDGSVSAGQATHHQQAYAQPASAADVGQAASGAGAQPPSPQASPAQTAYQQSSMPQGSAQGGYQQQSAASAQSAYQQPPMQPHYAAPLSSRDHVAAGLLAIFLGGFGVHKFYLGYNTQGFILLALSLVGGLFSFGLIAGVVWIISIIEGIIYLTKTQSEFEQLYVYGRHEWF